MAIDRKFVPRYDSPVFEIVVYRAGTPGQADGDAVEVSLLREDTETGEEAEVWYGPAASAGSGVYSVTLSSVQTQTLGFYRVVFTYEVDATEHLYVFEIEIGRSTPEYDILLPEWRRVVEGTWSRFGDTFDSPFGGPNLQTYAQSKFGRGRIAQLLPGAMTTLNTASSPHKVYEFNGSFPFDRWGDLLEHALYIEVLKHLVRSYVEQPETILGTSVSRVDRRDYMNRWQQVLDSEERSFQDDLDRYRHAHLGLGNFSVLVSGGGYGRLGPHVNAGGGGASAARGYFSVRRSH